jgi:hypothetical protein
MSELKDVKDRLDKLEDSFNRLLFIMGLENRSAASCADFREIKWREYIASLKTGKKASK